MRAKLFCRTGQLAGASFEIKDEATIGKSAENTIQLHPALISGKHARIFYDEKTKGYYLEDLNSQNGTRLDSVRVRGKERLGKLNIITFANTFDFLFQLADVEQQAVQPKAEIEVEPHPQKKHQVESRQKTIVSSDFDMLPEIKPAADGKQKTLYDDNPFISPLIPQEKEEHEKQSVASFREGQQPNEAERTKIGIDFTPLPTFSPETDRHAAQVQQGAASATAQRYVLVFEDIKGSCRSFDLRDGENLVGRDASCAIAIDEGSVSRTHAVLTVKGGEVRLKDLGSKNHTYIGKRKISSEVKIEEGTHIKFGLLKARLLRKPRT
jgi:pSer/pThr/pTyr-binding forkhead associated (FHA) protein